MLINITDPATMQTAAGIPELRLIRSNYAFSQSEVDHLRTLAHAVKEISLRPEMQRKAQLWQEHNDLKTRQPPVFIDPENGWNELIPASCLLCHDPLARVWEMSLRKKIYWADVLQDDKVIDDFFDVPYYFTDDGWGVAVTHIGGEGGGAYTVKKAIEHYATDFEKLHPPRITIDEEKSTRVLELAHIVFGGILTVRRMHAWWWTLGMCWDYVDLRGMEDFMCDFLTEPDMVHQMFDFLCRSKLAMLDFLEQDHLLTGNQGNVYIGSGGFGFTDDLPPAQGAVSTQQMWGFCDAQETAQMNPDLYGEFILPYHKRILQRFGLSCYGCCEGFDNRFHYVKQLPHLRKVSVSPWANWETVPELLGDRYVASVKPHPAPLAQFDLNEDVVRRDCKNAVEQTFGGVCEFIMKDNNTLGNNPYNASRWVQIMREEIDRKY